MIFNLFYKHCKKFHSHIFFFLLSVPMQSLSLSLSLSLSAREGLAYYNCVITTFMVLRNATLLP